MPRALHLGEHTAYTMNPNARPVAGVARANGSAPGSASAAPWSTAPYKPPRDPNAPIPRFQDQVDGKARICHGKTKKGADCGFPPRIGSDFCKWHGPKDDG